MQKEISNRRRSMVNVYARTLSLNETVKFVSKKFNVKPQVLRTDWSRRHTWPKQVFDDVNSPVLRDFYVLAVHRVFLQVEEELAKTTNPNCKVALLKSKAEILFKLIGIQRSVVEQGLVSRIEAMEKKLEFLESENQMEMKK